MDSILYKYIFLRKKDSESVADYLRRAEEIEKRLTEKLDEPSRRLLSEMRLNPTDGIEEREFDERVRLLFLGVKIGMEIQQAFTEFGA